MRYLNKRDEFLKNYRKIVVNKKSYVPSDDAEMITEDSGPFANDIGWGDSLLGRLINSAIRKAKIGASLLRIKSVESRLREAMDDLLLSATAAELDEADRNLYAKALISTYLISIEEAVERGAYLTELKSLTEVAISAVEKSEELEDKNELLRQLNEWKKYIDQFKEEEAETEENRTEEVDATGPTNNYLTNFKHLFNMLLVYQGIEREKGEFYKGQAADKAGLPNQASKAAPVPQTNVSVGAGISVNASASMLKYDQFIMLEASGATGSSIGASAGKITGKIWKFITGQKDERKLDADTKILWDSMKPLYQLFMAEKGVLVKDGELHKMLQNPMMVKGADYGKYKSNIDKIYTFARSASGINEDVHSFLGQYEKIGKYIASIYSVTKRHIDGKFMQYPGSKGEIWDDMIDSIAAFNKTMSEVFAVKSKWNAGEKATWKSETTGDRIEKEIIRIEGKKLIFKDKKGEEYSKFMSEVEKVEESSKHRIILEAEETGNEDDVIKDDSGIVSKWKNPSSVVKIQDWWGKKMDLKQWVLEKTEVEKVRINLEKKLAEKKDSVVIQGMDPVLEIVKVFNRAYKLHTTQVIPSGRSGGKVSNKTFLEYHCFGSGSPASAGESGGPYRNIVVFNQWEDCVNDVMKDKRYQKIFNVGTRLKVGSEYIEKAGSNLRKFMTDMLDGEELYKGGSGKEQGAQAKFLDKYFGYKADTEGKDTYYSESDREAVTSLSGNIKNVVLEAKQSNVAVKFKDAGDLLGTFFKLTLKKGNDPSIGYYFYVQAVAGNMLYLSFSNTAFYMQQYIKQEKGTSVILPNGFRKEKAGDYGPYAIYATNINSEILFKEDGSVVLPKNIDMSFIMKKKKSTEDGEREKNDNSIGNVQYSVSEKETYTVEEAVIIVQEGSEERIKASYNSAYRAMQDHGGFKDISSIPEMKNAGIKKS